MGNQYTSSAEKRTKEFIKNYHPEWEYLSGDSIGSDGKITIKHKCGYVVDKSAITIRRKNRILKCEACTKESIAKRKEESRHIKAKKKADALKERKIQRMYKSAKQVSMGVCIQCNSLYIKTQENKIYCSDKCKNQNKYFLKDGYRYLFPLKEVFKRDNGICYLCGELCDWDDYRIVNGVTIYGNRYPSRDHIIPKSKVLDNNTNTWENIRLAHRICNSYKRDLMPPYLEKQGGIVLAPVMALFQTSCERVI